MPDHTTGPAIRRLLHRAFTIDDAAAFYAINGNPDVMRLTGEPPLASVERAREANFDSPDFHAVGYGCWAWSGLSRWSFPRTPPRSGCSRRSE